jgi:hypothetical protein
MGCSVSKYAVRSGSALKRTGGRIERAAHRLRAAYVGQSAAEMVAAGDAHLAGREFEAAVAYYRWAIAKVII